MPGPVSHCSVQLHGEGADNEPVSSDASFDGRFTMSDISQGEGWCVASDGRWYPPQDHPNHGSGSSSQVPLLQNQADSEPSTDRSAVAVATARQCVNGHEMPESHVFCSGCGSQESEESEELSNATARQCVNGHEIPESHDFCTVCGGGRSEVPADTSALEVLGVIEHRSKNARIVVAVVAVCVLGLGLGLGLGLTGGSSGGSSSNTPTTSVAVSGTQQAVNDLDSLGGTSTTPLTAR